MKAMLFSDIHLGLSRDSETFYKTTLDFGDWLVDEARQRGISTLICGGDVFHYRKAIFSPTLNVAREFFEKLSDFDVRIITGNHDCYYLDNSKIHSLSLLKAWENIQIYDTPHYEIIDGRRVGFIPWGTTVNEIEPCDIMFGHFSISGFHMNASRVCVDGMTVKELLKKSSLIFSGHFHKPQKQDYKAGTLVYMGSPFQHNWGEAGEDKFIYELDFAAKKYVPILNTISPKHIEIKTKADVDLVDGNIVRVVTSKDSDILTLLTKKTPISADVVIEDKVLQLATKTIKDFKGVDIMDGFSEVVDTLEVSKHLKTKILDMCKDFYQKA
jgi:DNA repair exonuclease SbcCD nuclease subunit